MVSVFNSKKTNTGFSLMLCRQGGGQSHQAGFSLLKERLKKCPLGSKGFSTSLLKHKMFLLSLYFFLKLFSLDYTIKPEMFND